MRKIDRQVGWPSAYLLSLFTRKQDKLPGEDISTIIVSKYFGIGSITLSTPLLQSLRARFPNSKILFATFKNNEELLRLFPFVDEVVTIRNNKISQFVADTIKTIVYFRHRAKPELYIDMEFFSHYSSLMAWLSGSRFRVGFHTSLLPRGRLLTHRVAFNPHRYITDAFNALGNIIGTKKQYPLYRPAINNTYVQNITGWLIKRGLRKKTYIVVNTQSSDHLGELKSWPYDKWRDLIAKIVGSLKIPVILTGLKEDHARIESIVSPLPELFRKSVYNAAGQISLGEFLALLEMSRFLITIDSGPLHLAQALEVPCVALFGPETPILYGPQKKNDRTINLDIYCSPCCNVLDGKKAECTNPSYQECMRGIEVDKVWREVVELNKCCQA